MNGFTATIDPNFVRVVQARTGDLWTFPIQTENGQRVIGWAVASQVGAGPRGMSPHTSMTSRARQFARQEALSKGLIDH